MKKKILVILGHPSVNSFNKAIADSYISGAEKAGFEVRKIYISKLKFDFVLHEGYNKPQKLEQDLINSQKDITWAEHLVLIYPIWWTSAPALFKSFVERVFLPDFAFKYENGGKVKRLLRGKTSSIIMTTGGPGVWYSLFGKIMNKQVAIGILNFCGIKIKKQIFFSGMRNLDKNRAKRILEKVRELGRKGI